MRLSPLVAVVNESSVVSDDEINNAMFAFRNAVHYHFRPFWNETCTLSFYPKGLPVPLGAWQIAILDDSDQAGALGYHNETPEGLPLAKVFAKTDKEYGYSWTVTFSHELFEMLADPYICQAAQVTNTQFYAYEVGDPVENDKYGRWMKGADGHPTVLVSNFITPAWFQPWVPGPYDWQHYCSHATQVLSGGYVSIFVSGKGWTEYQMKEVQLHQVPLELDNVRFRDRSRAQEVNQGLVK